MIEEDLSLRPRYSPPIGHRQGSVCSNNDANLAYVWIPDVAVNGHQISRWDDNPHPLPGMCSPPLLQLLISGGSTSPPNKCLSCNNIQV